MLHCVFQIEHHPMPRAGNCMYYIIYLRPIVGRVYFSEDIVLTPYFQLRGNEIIPVYYLFRRSPWTGATQQYYYDDDRLLQFQTDLHFKCVTEVTKHILTKALLLVGACQVIAVQALSENRLLTAAST